MENIGKVGHNSEESNGEVRINVVESLISSMTSALAALDNDSFTVCIFRVFEKYRKSNEDAYTPRVVSIGPLHHGKYNLQAMEAYKLTYMLNFIRKFGIEIEKLITYVAKMEGSIRRCYEDTSQFKSKEFCQMILVDGIFVVQLFVKNLIQMREFDDMLFANIWMASDLMHDMLLLENQLPLNFIMGLFELVDSSLVHKMSFYELCLDYFQQVGNTKRLKLECGYERPRHLVEFLAILHRPSSRKMKMVSNCGFVYTRSASELHAAGVHFCVGTGDMFDASFESGLLKVPHLTVNYVTETFFRNLIASEQCGHYDKLITSYVIFMDSLINTAEDVELLVEHKVIDNLLGENQLVANLFNNLLKEVREEQKEFYFAKICMDLSKYKKGYTLKVVRFRWKRKWLRWKLILIDRYFNNPWSVISFVAAATVVVLTIVQTVCSILGLKQ